ncbi:MAG TPA: hypothetical protein VJ911_07395 [Cryomorphaceae bacterium]|nr:hypothetical protein [Cryomorphaceae bacterium]
MKIFRNRTILLFFASIFLFTIACEKDDDEPDTNNNNNNNSSSSGSGGADVSISGDVTLDLGDYATWEITDDQLLRIRIGSEFPENIVLNYRLGSNAISDFQGGTYTAVSATYTGQPADEIAFQYNGDDPQFPDDGTITITDVSGTSIEGELDVTMSPISGSSSQVMGSFNAVPLE